MTREQRRRILEEQRSRLEAERAGVENDMATASIAAMAEYTAKLERIERRLREVDRELGEIDQGDAMTQAYRRAVFELNQWFGNLQTRLFNLERRIEMQFAQDVQERHERQEALDEALDDIRRLVERGADERRAQLREMRLMVMAVMAVQVALVALLFWGALAMRPILELWR